MSQYLPEVKFDPLSSFCWKSLIPYTYFKFISTIFKDYNYKNFSFYFFVIFFIFILEGDNNELKGTWGVSNGFINGA